MYKYVSLAKAGEEERETRKSTADRVRKGDWCKRARACLHWLRKTKSGYLSDQEKTEALIGREWKPEDVDRMQMLEYLLSHFKELGL